MTRTAPSRTGHPVPIAALAAGALALVLLLIGSFVDFPIGRHDDRGFGLDTERQGLGTLVMIVIFVAVGSLAVFGVVVPRGLRQDAGRTASYALAVAVVGALSIVVLWTGLPVILAGAAARLALDAKARLHHLPVAAAAALGLAMLTTLLNAAVAVLG